MWSRPTGLSKKPQVWRKPCQPVPYKKSVERPRTAHFLRHPDVPRDRPGFLIGHWTARHLEGQLHLTVMVALVPEHVLEQEDRMVVVKVHLTACLHPAPYRVPHRLGAVVQHLRDATRVTLDHPLFLGQLSGELGGVLEDEHKSYKVDVCEQLRDGWAAPHRPGLQPALREGAKQVEQDDVVPVPGVQQSLKQPLVWCVRHIHTPFV